MALNWLSQVLSNLSSIQNEDFMTVWYNSKIIVNIFVFDFRSANVVGCLCATFWPNCSDTRMLYTTRIASKNDAKRTAFSLTSKAELSA